MPGTELTPEGRAVLIRNLTLAGWLLLGGSFGLIAFQLERARDVGEQRFAGIWDQRIEVLSFLMLPPNLVVLAPPVFVAAAVTWLAGTANAIRGCRRCCGSVAGWRSSTR